jgi:hypothetical protein
MATGLEARTHLQILLPSHRVYLRSSSPATLYAILRSLLRVAKTGVGVLMARLLGREIAKTIMLALLVVVQAMGLPGRAIAKKVFALLVVM